MTVLAQAYLRTRSLRDLLEERGVNARISDRDPCVFTLNYDQIRVADSDALAAQCRGLVLRASGWSGSPSLTRSAGRTPRGSSTTGGTSFGGR